MVELGKEISDRSSLEQLIVDNPDLERLEVLLDQFNIFEAIGAVRQELRHSDFLAFLLSPQQNHGLGDTFLKSLLQKVLLAARDKEQPINLVDLDVWSLEDTISLREWHNIDILLQNDEHKLVILIENKIDAAEGSDQLKRYFDTVADHYADWKVIRLFLTPEGHQPSHQEFLPVSYNTVASLIEGLIARHASTLGTDIKTLLCHYAQMLRRHIVNESEIAELCLRIYRKHQRAFDLIYSYRPNLQTEIRDALVDIVRGSNVFALDRISNVSPLFVPSSWDSYIIKADKGWSTEGRIMLFWFENLPNRLRLILEIGPGPREIRQQLFNAAQNNKPPFRPGSKTLYPTYSRIWSRQFLGASDYDGADISSLTQKLQTQWDVFVGNDLPKIEDVIHQEMLSFGR